MYLEKTGLEAGYSLAEGIYLEFFMMPVGQRGRLSETGIRLKGAV
jgi:hypothetical protein